MSRDDRDHVLVRGCATCPFQHSTHDGEVDCTRLERYVDVPDDVDLEEWRPETCPARGIEVTYVPLSVQEAALSEAGLGRRDLGVPLRVRNWCAWTMSRWLRVAGRPAPPPGSRAEIGAKRLGRWLGAQPGYDLLEGHDVPEELRPGDVVVYHRGGWRGHVRVCARGGRTTVLVGGNEGGRVRTSTYVGLGWMESLLGVAFVVRRIVEP